LDKVERAAEGFYQALLSGEELEDEIERNAAFEASARIELHLEKMHCVLSRMDDFKNATEGFLTAAVVVEHELKDGAGKGSVEGEAWNKLVRGLSQWFEGKGLKPTASKGRNKSKSDKPSAFVAFIHKLQSTFPKRLRRHVTRDALPKGISDALKTGR